MKVTILEYPTNEDWIAVKQRALVTVGLKAKTPPTNEWKYKILKARHSPIRRLRFSVLFEDIPNWVAVHLVRHIHAQPYVKSQRNDRQSDYDRTKAPRMHKRCLCCLSYHSPVWDIQTVETILADMVTILLLEMQTIQKLAQLH